MFTLSSAFGTCPLSTVCGIAVGVYSSFCGVTSTVTGTSSVLLSGYVINTFPGLLPGVLVFGCSDHVYVVPSGKPFVLILFSGSGTSLWRTVWFGSFAVGLNVSFCSFTVTGTSTSSSVPSG